MYWCAGYFALVTVAILVGGSDGNCEADNHVNGCSIPLSAPFPYKTNFKPACNKHDICYFCGQKYGWTRDDCDKAFKRDMEAICSSLYTNTKRSFFTSLGNAWKIAKEIGEWPFVTGKLDHCKKGAKIYYMSVDFFGASNYNSQPPQWCNDRCVIPKGNPNALLKK